jgi:DNA-binding transcriptional LysR family regulator
MTVESADPERSPVRGVSAGTRDARFGDQPGCSFRRWSRSRHRSHSLDRTLRWFQSGGPSVSAARSPSGSPPHVPGPANRQADLTQYDGRPSEVRLGPTVACVDGSQRKRMIVSVLRLITSAVVSVVELRQIEYFLAVVEEGSFTRAATRVFMVQSSLSASLLTLERELGTDLFIRGRRGAELTDAGRAFLGPARAALAEADRARDAVAEVKGLLRGSVRIATMPVAMPRSNDLIETIRRFQEEHPAVHVQVVPTDPKSMLYLVTDGQVDFAITPRLDQASSTIRFEPLISTDVVLLCPVGHRLSGCRDVEPREVVDESIIDLPCSWRSRELFDRFLAEDSVQRQVTLEVDDWLGVLAMVQRGMGISYGPHVCIDKATFSGVDIVTLAHAPVWELGVASRDDALRGAAGRAFLAAYRERCGEHVNS